MPIAKQIKLIDKYEFAKAALDENSENFVIHLVALEILSEMTIQPSRVA